MASVISLKNSVGNWVDGDCFWGRENDLSLLQNSIDAGSHIIITAVRRMGKTSLMHETARILKDQYSCIFIDVENAQDAPDAIAELSYGLRLHKSLIKKAKELIGNVFNKIESIGNESFKVKFRDSLTSGNWKQKGDELFQILASEEKPVVLFIDELPILVNRLLKGDDKKITNERRKAADDFLTWLRKMGQAYQGKVRIIVSGSIGLIPILNQGNLSATLNNFESFDLEPWDTKTAAACLRALAKEKGIDFQDGAVDAMIDRLGCCIPHHVQLFFKHVDEYCVRNECKDFPSIAVDDVYQNKLLNLRGNIDLDHYNERLDMVCLKEHIDLAKEILKETAATGKLTRKALNALPAYHPSLEHNFNEALDDVLSILEHDGYLKQEKKHYVFQSFLLRDWWKKRHGRNYTPILKRKETN